jgi:RNA polymerase sigma factor (sigma-70 family)
MQQTNWSEIYNTLSPKLLGICRRYIKDLATAEDIVQDSFIVAIQKENDLKNKETLNGWLSRIVINRAINYLKKEHLINYSDSNYIESIDETTEMNTLELNNKSAILSADFSHEDLLEAIDSLSENHKSVFNLYIIDEFSHLKISKLLKISVGTSKSSLSRARKNVQHYLINKLNATKTDEKKKRRIAFLLFFGFGNQLFANYYKNSFSTFEIQPKRSFINSREIENIEPYQVFKQNGFSNYLKTGIIAALIIVAFLLYIFIQKEEKTTQISTFEQPIQKEKIVVNKQSIDSSKKKNINTKENRVEKVNVIVNNNSNSTIKAKIAEAIAKKDSIIEPITPKVVVIKRQIIKKDTVYVEKK